MSYLDTLLMIKQAPKADIAKGKMVIDHSRGFRKMAVHWKAPKEGEGKLNVDGAFSTDG
jgi:hypothetical protein